MPLVLPQSYTLGRVARISKAPQTIGDHLRRRLALKSLQRDVAKLLGVTESSIWNWETNGCEPEIRFLPAIIGFLGCNPLPEGETLAEQLIRHRTSLGLSRGEAAKRLGVDPGMLARWERARGSRREPTWLQCIDFSAVATVGATVRRAG